MTDATLKRATPDQEPPVLQLFREYKPDLEAALPEGMSPDRFWSICANQLRHTPALKNVEPMTFMGSMLMAAQQGLEPGPPLGLSWIIPRRNKGRQEATYQIGYRGLAQLAYRSGAVKRVEAHIVHEGDDFDYRFGTGGWRLDWRPEGSPGRDWSHVLCVAETAMGAEIVEVMTAGEVREHRDRYVRKDSKGQWPQAWRDNEPEMARKTVTAKLVRQLPMSVEFRQSLVADGSSPRELVPDLAGTLELGAGDDEANDAEGSE